MRRFGMQGCGVLLTVAMGLVAVSAAAEVQQLVIALEATPPVRVDSEHGTQYEIQDFGLRPVPGQPLLPARTLSYLLPPGARVLGLDILSETRRPLLGSPLPRLAPAFLTPADALSGHTQVLPGAQALPVAVTLVAAGALRGLAYAALCHRPVQIEPGTNALSLVENIEVVIRYEVDPAAASPWMLDAADLAQAQDLFEDPAGNRALYSAPSGRDRGPDYLVITPSFCMNAVMASEFTAWKTSLGHEVATIATDDPAIQGQPGTDLAARIRSYLRANCPAWGTRYLLLVGDYASVPMRYCYPDPYDHSHSPYNSGYPGGSFPTDAYYADLSLPDDESWDLDGDGFPGEYGQDLPDFLAELAVGRIPTNSFSRITETLDRIVAYEQDNGAWKNRALHGGAILFYENQNHTVIPFRDGAVALDIIESESMQDWTLSRYCEHAGLVPSLYDWAPLSGTSFLGDWNANAYGVVNWSGHGSPDGAWRLIWLWDDGDGVFETDGSDGYEWDQFVGTGLSFSMPEPAIVCAISCNVGYPEPNNVGNFGIELVTAPWNGAAVSLICAARPARVTADWPLTPGGAESYVKEFNRLLIGPGADPRCVGDAFVDSKFYCHINYGWAHWGEYANLYVYNHYGDPALNRTGALTAVVEDAAGSLATSQAQLSGFPNPFRARTRLRFATSGAASAELTVYDPAGRRQRRLTAAIGADGRGELIWDGRDDSGRALAAGVYLCRLRAGEQSATRRLLLLR